ncbi:hypothetical protein CDD83_646 [Cordyceps sp. RAO-2017]|nr:hypothetical protein CDD83_646 [Cordyceps sp. RAO-2017]
MLETFIDGMLALEGVEGVTPRPVFFVVRENRGTTRLAMRQLTQGHGESWPGTRRGKSVFSSFLVRDPSHLPPEAVASGQERQLVLALGWICLHVISTRDRLDAYASSLHVTELTMLPQAARRRWAERHNIPIDRDASLGPARCRAGLKHDAQPHADSSSVPRRSNQPRVSSFIPSYSASLARRSSVSAPLPLAMTSEPPQTCPPTPEPAPDRGNAPRTPAIAS